MPQNEGFLFLHMLITFLTLLAFLIVFVLKYNFLPVMKLLRLLILVDKTENFYGLDHLFVYFVKLLRVTELFFIPILFLEFLIHDTIFYAFVNLFFNGFFFIKFFNIF